ncbi:hypothetical protein LguiA_035497 [Lonicera macranthoides]
MAFQSSLALSFVFFTGILFCSSHAYRFNVGGKDGWVSNPSENFNQWSSRMRFLINDTLFFKYNKGSDSVLVVSKDDYDNCNTDKPILKMDDGDSVFTFDRSGPFYFISGNKSNCDKGQKLTVVVLSLRNRSPPTTGAPPPVTAAAPTPATTPANPSPEMAPTPGEADSPISSSPSMTPAMIPGSPMASSPGSSGGAVSPAPGGGTSADSSGPPPLGSYAPAAITPSSVFWVSSVSFALSVAMGSFINSH